MSALDLHTSYEDARFSVFQLRSIDYMRSRVRGVQGLVHEGFLGEL